MARKQLPRRLIQLYVGLWLYGLSGALQVRSELGLDRGMSSTRAWPGISDWPSARS
jgi:hypothetical protein